MGEIFSRERPRTALEFTGERYTSASAGQIELEHLHRFLIARDQTRGKDVLDVACGEGMGAAYIAQVARSAIGIDIDEASVCHARAAYRRPNLNYLRATGTALPLRDDSVDVVTSFETIEHLVDHATFLSEIRRVLRPSGLLVLSTPDQDIYSPSSEPANIHHLRELSREEFRALVTAHFPHVRFFGQRTMIGSAVFERDAAPGTPSSPFLTFESRRGGLAEQNAGLPRAKYIIACASDDPEIVRRCGNSLYIDTDEVDATRVGFANLRDEAGRIRNDLAASLAAETRWRDDIQTIEARLRDAVEAGDEHRTDKESALAEAANARRQLSEQRDRLEWFEERIGSLEAELETHASASARHLDAARVALDDETARGKASDAAWRADLDTANRQAQTNADLLQIERQAAEAAVEESRRLQGEAWLAAERIAALEPDAALAGALFAGALSQGRPSVPDTAEGWMTFGRKAANADNALTALAAFRQAARIAPDSVAAQSVRGEMCRKLGYGPEAEAAFCAAFKADPGSPQAREGLASIGYDLAHMVDLLAERPDSAARPGVTLAGRWLRSRARAAVARHDWRGAVRSWSKIVERESKSAFAWIKYGDALSASGRSAESETAYLRAIGLDPQHPLSRRRAIDLRAGGLVLGRRMVKDVREAGVLMSVTGEDPQIELTTDGRALPSGWVLFRISTPTFVAGFEPRLMVRAGRSGAARTYDLPLMEHAGFHEVLLQLPPAVTEIRFLSNCAPGTLFGVSEIVAKQGEGLASRTYLRALPSEAATDAHGGPQAALRFAALADLALEPEGWFRSTGGDPQFELTPGEGALPQGWSLFTITFEGVEGILDPCLYAFADAVTPFRLPEIREPGTIEVLLRLPEGLKALRFDPSTRPDTRFRLTAIAARSDLPLSETAYVSLPSAGEQRDGTPDRIPHERLALGLNPVKDLRADGDLLVTTGSDPQFEVVIPGGECPRGPTLFAIDVERVAPALAPILYVHSKHGSIFAYPLGEMRTPRRIEVLVVLPPDVTALRLDPAEAADVVFSLGEVSIRSLRSVETKIFALDAKAEDVLRPELVVEQPFRDFHLVPLQHLARESGHAFRSTGHDPQIDLGWAGATVPSGWTLFRLELSASSALAAILYAFGPNGVEPITLPPFIGEVRAELLIRLPDEVTQLRFDPTDVEGVEFVLERIAVLPLSEVRPATFKALASEPRQLEYETWVAAYDTLTERDCATIRGAVEGLVRTPLISVVMPVYNPRPRYLRRALDSVIEQLYPHWELCIADDCSTNPEIRTVLEEYASRDARIKVVFREENGHISAASNSAIELVAGSFVALMDHDDELPRHALYMVARELNLYPDTDIIYTDEDKIDNEGRRHDAYFKTEWNLDLFYSQNIVAHLGVYRTSLVRMIDGFRVGFEGSQDYDFTLRAIERTTRDRIRHIPHVLYHWRIFRGVTSFSTNNPDKSVSTAHRAMVDHFAEKGEAVEVREIESFPSWWRIVRPLPAEAPGVSLIIPTRDRVHLLRPCVSGILLRTDYPNVEVIVVDNGSTEDETFAYFKELAGDPRVTILRIEGPFNYSKLNNDAVKVARHPYLGFINNDIEVIEPDWLAEMMAQAVRPGVGAVGAKLLYTSGALQHAGVTLGVYGVAAHGHRHQPHDSIGYFGRPQLQHEVSAVTAACLIMPKALFETLGGFDAVNLVVSYNDVDLCLRVREAGYQIVYTPFATLYHHESASRGADVTPEQKELQRVERGYMRERWGTILDTDPAYSPNLSLANEDYRLAFPPRRLKPWLADPSRADRLSAAGEEALQPVAPDRLRTLAAGTAVIVASADPFAMLGEIARNLTADGPQPSGVFLVHKPRIAEPARCETIAAAFRAAHPTIRLTLVPDDTHDDDVGRAARIGLRAAANEADHAVLVLADGRLARGALANLLKAYAASERDAVIAARLMGPNGELQEQLSQSGPDFESVLRDAPADGNSERVRLWETRDAASLAQEPPLQATNLLGSGLLFGRIATLAPEDGAVFDERFLTPARTESLTRRLEREGIATLTTRASLLTLAGEPHRGIADHWRALHDYALTSRPDAGETSSAIDFVCPFHRGDVLVGVQVAHAAHRAGHDITLHVAQDLKSWVDDFAPDFPVAGIPVSVPPADRTPLHLILSCAHVVKYAGRSARIARSHPDRGLDETGCNLVENMLESVGLPSDTRLDNLLPKPSAAQAAEADRLASQFGDRFVLLHRSGGWALKTLPDNVQDALVAFLTRRGYRVVQIGGPGDAPIAGCGGAILQNLSLGHWAVLFNRARAIFGIDSWSAHLASILDRPQVSFYGSTHPRHVSSKAAFLHRSAPCLMLGPTVPCAPCNAFTCKIVPSSFCLGFVFDETAIEAFLTELERQPNA